MPRSDDCACGLHDYCNICDCECHQVHGPCQCVVKNREEGESQREWFKRWMCMFHWMQTDYYQNKLAITDRTFPIKKKI